MALEQERKKHIAQVANRVGLVALAICTIGAGVIGFLGLAAYVVKLFK